MSVEVLLQNICRTTGEGPHWDDATQSLYYVDINNGFIHKWDSLTGEDKTHKFDQTVSFIIPCQERGFVLGLGQTVTHFDWNSGLATTLATVDKEKKSRFNDGKCDSSGRLFCGTMGAERIVAQPEPNQGSLFSLERDGEVRSHVERVTISNGMAWTSDSKTMYYIDSIPERKLMAYDYDLATGAMSNARPVFDLRTTDAPVEAFLDGMTIDTDGKLWVAVYHGGNVLQVDPETGKVLRSISLPARRITSCCWGGRHLDELYVTCSAHGLTSEERQLTPLAGSVFRVTGLGSKGFLLIGLRGKFDMIVKQAH